MTRAQQREFFQLAGVYLGCRLRAMGGDVAGLEPRKGPLHFTMLGMRDYAHEMKLLLEEVRYLQSLSFFVTPDRGAEMWDPNRPVPHAVYPIPADLTAYVRAIRATAPSAKPRPA